MSVRCSRSSFIKLLRAFLACCVAAAGCEPPEVFGPGRDEAVFPIAALQHAGEGRCADGAACPAAETCADGRRCPAHGDRVIVEDAVVTAVDSFDEDGAGSVGGVWVQSAAGGPWSGIQLYEPAVAPVRARLSPGDVVRVAGTYEEFVLREADGTPMDPRGRLTEITRGSVRKTGETTPLDPIPVAAADLGNRSAAEQWEGVLVRVEGVAVRAVYDLYGDAPTTAGFEVSKALYEIPGLGPGATFRSITGVVSYFFGFKLLPRGPDDIER